MTATTGEIYARPTRAHKGHPKYGVRVKLDFGETFERESTLAVTAFNDYFRMGATRSLRKLVDHYEQLQAKFEETGDPMYEPPTVSIKSLGTWSGVFRWQERIEAFYVHQEELKAASRKEVLSSLLALDFERIRMLQTMADGLYKFKYMPWHSQQEKLAAGKALTYVDNDGETKEEKVIVCPMNEITQLRGILNDLALETGGRSGVGADRTLTPAGYTVDDLEAAVTLAEEYEQKLGAWQLDVSRGNVSRSVEAN